MADATAEVIIMAYGMQLCSVWVLALTDNVSLQLRDTSTSGRVCQLVLPVIVVVTPLSSYKWLSMASFII